jgi:cellulose synthase/poly-beta-1,6-N-acetylglucosamine synthase-like glycosyltransferase
MNDATKQSVASACKAETFVSLRPYRLEGEDSLVDPVDATTARILSADVARRHQLLPFARVGHCIWLAAVRPQDIMGTFRELGLPSAYTYRWCYAEREDILFAQDRVYGMVDGEGGERLGSYLLRTGRITTQDLVAALADQNVDEAGQKLGAILLQRGVITNWNIAEAVASQRGYPLIDLLGQTALTHNLVSSRLDATWELVEERFWHRHLVVPLDEDEQTLTLAMVDVDDREALEYLEKTAKKRLRVFVTGSRDVVHVLNQRFGATQSLESQLSLFRLRPEDSAATPVSRAQWLWMVALLVVAVVGFVLRPVWTGTFLAATVEVVYASVSLFRLFTMSAAIRSNTEYVVTEADMQSVPPTSLPEYTVLVPLYKEADVLPMLTKALQQLRYPKDRLDVKLLLEEDDRDTLEVALNARLPSYMEIVVVPHSEPQTKPKACNYGLAKARGEYVVIFDAEDVPEPDQLLKAVTIFREEQNENLACIQAKLSYYNENQNVLTRWFTAEYSNWFELLLPSLFRLDMPIPLGGTSNHFRTDVLRALGAWDPFNVTEDADLGIRLHKSGYRTGVMNSTTFEEANSDFVNWVRQRSRWVKGYIQTWFVHMRHPVRLFQELGNVGFWGFQSTIGGTPLQFLLNPILWGLTVAWYVFGSSYLQHVFSGWIYYLGNVSLFFGNVAFIYANLMGVVKAQRWSLAKWCLLTPVYWVFMSIAAYKALYQFFLRPSYWEKTIHGMASEHFASTVEQMGAGM